MNDLLLPPLPIDLETAHKELRYWQNEVLNARKLAVKEVERRVLDNKSSAGQIRKLKAALEKYRDQHLIIR